MMSPIIGETLRVWFLSALVVHAAVAGNPDAKRLYDDLLSNYNKLVRPVVNTSDVLRVCIKLKLSQLIDVNLKNQIMTTNLWVEQSWYDYKLRWEPKEYGGVQMLHVPSDHIWRPDIVLYNKNEKFYTCCDEPYLDITFNITMRRKTLFYTVNIIIPCMGISFLTVLTFYLPSDSGEKVTLSISILISLHVFFLLVVEIIPPTSLVVPLLGKYLIFAMILVSISICVTVVVLNVHFRSPQTHRMAPWVKRVFIHILPRLLVMRRPQYKFETNSRYTSGRVLMRAVKGKEKTCYYPYHPSTQEDSEGRFTPKRFHSRPSSKEDLSPSSLTDGARFGGSCLIHGPPLPPLQLHTECEDFSGSVDVGVEEVKSPVLRSPPAFSHSRCPPELHRSCICVRFIAEHTKMLEDSTKVKEDWKYVAMVLDRLFLWIFTLAVLVGTAGIILQAPTLYDDRTPIDKKFSQFATTTVVLPHRTN
ncbi:acetylcholine receptor subunit alpha-like isoform X5 [Pseudomyrmex gracilis]|uniref:acetylcholine receptor subunit alpha-like isoform X5 n=1 Tax=Pseudomyrmex gracilis TaxID=219809 RepID=UPI000995D1F7|nr:acetylcholine receptor subunit alpha-like isoform X5 [Pseudomyrmex gracilis]